MARTKSRPLPTAKSDRPAPPVCRANPRLETLDRRELPSASPFTAPAEGSKISGLTEHTWVADANGLYHTKTDLAAEWKGFQAQMQAGHAADLSAVQRLEGNAETVFDNTGLHTASAATQLKGREDAQREFDAIAAAQAINQDRYGIDSSAPLTETSYLKLESTLQTNAKLYELGLQGHGLNNIAITRYKGYTNDIQNAVDNTTTYIGGGLDNNESALNDYFDDVVMTHAPFPVVWQNGELTQLNQNADAEDNLLKTVVGVDDVAYGRTLTAADFAAAQSNKNNNYVSPFQKLVEASAIDMSAKPSGGVIHGELGPVSTTLKGLTPHAWKADADGLFHTATNLAAEWKKLYRTALDGHAGRLTPVQRLEANAEAVFENTALNAVSAADGQKYREDAQRQFDAMAAGMKIDQRRYGTDPTAAFTPATYDQLTKTIGANATLLELSEQGHGLNNPPAARYKGYTNDFQNGVDGATKYVGGGLNNNQNALTDFFDDTILSHAPFPVVYQNGKLQQLNQNGDAENTLTEQVKALDVSMFYRVYTADDFRK